MSKNILHPRKYIMCNNKNILNYKKIFSSGDGAKRTLVTCTRTACRGAGAGAGRSSTMISTYPGSWGRGTPPEGGAATSTPPTTTPSTTGTRSAQHSSRPRHSLVAVDVTLEPLFCQSPFQHFLIIRL